MYLVYSIYIHTRLSQNEIFAFHITRLGTILGKLSNKSFVSLGKPTIKIDEGGNASLKNFIWHINVTRIVTCKSPLLCMLNIAHNNQ